MDGPGTFSIQVPGDGRAYPVGTRVRVGLNGDDGTVIRDPAGDLVVVACEAGFFGGTRAGLVLQLAPYLST